MDDAKMWAEIRKAFSETIGFDMSAAGQDLAFGFAAGFSAGRQSIAADLRRDSENQNSWLWFELGESALLKVAEWIEKTGMKADSCEEHSQDLSKGNKLE